MEKKLKIYIPKNSFEIDKCLITTLVLWSLSFLFNFGESIFPEYEEELNLLLGLFTIIAVLYSLYFIISNLFKCETTNGEFNGHLIIDSEKIT